MTPQEQARLLEAAEKLQALMDGVSASHPSGEPEWTDDDAEELDHLALNATGDVKKAAQAARHGLLNVRRILVSTSEYGRRPAQDRIDAYREYHLYSVLALFRLIESLTPTPEVPTKPDDVLSQFRKWIRTFPALQ